MSIALQPQPPSLPPTTVEDAPTTGRPKLRDSCEPCSHAKVRCGKEKPTCSRCQLRNLSCEYCPTARTGRPPRSSTDGAPAKRSKKNSKRSTDESKRHSSYAQNGTSPAASTSAPLRADSLFSTHSQDYLMGGLPIDYSGAGPDPFSMTDAYSMDFPPMMATDTTGFDDLFSMDNICDLTNPALDSFMQPEAQCMTNNPVNAPTPPCSLTNLNLVDSKELFHSPADMRAPQQTQVHVHSDDVSQSCLIKALGFLNSLIPESSKACPIPESQNSRRDSSTSIPSVIEENSKTMRSIEAILECPCSQDGYLLVMLYLIVLKILGWYAAAARVATASSEENHGSSDRLSSFSRNSSCSRLDEFPVMANGINNNNSRDDGGRMAAQRILGELHRVQSIRDKLSTRMKGTNLRDVRRGRSSPFSQDGRDDGEANISPLSGTMADQIEASLRARLRGVSSKIIELLQQD